MSAEDPLFYVIKFKRRDEGKGYEWIRLEGPAWPLRLGIHNIEFTTLRAAGYFAQHHAAGRPALLRVDTHPYGFGPERVIPPVEVMPLPASHESNGEEDEFFRFFDQWPMQFQALGTPPHPALGKRAKEHPAAFRWDGSRRVWKLADQAENLATAVKDAIAAERQRLEAILATDEPDGKWHYSGKRREWRERCDRAKERLARLNRGEWPLDNPDDTPY